MKTFNYSEIDGICAEIKNHGFALINDVLSVEECDLFKKMLERDYQNFSNQYVNSTTTTHGLNDKTWEKVVYNMHNKDLRYFDLFDHPKVLPVVKELLTEGSYQHSESFNLLNISARCPLRGAKKQQLHLDSNLPGRDSFPLIMVVLYMLDDFNRDNGSTRLLPGSHRFSEYAEDGKTYQEEVVADASKGSVLIFDGSLWHGGTDKLSEGDRWAVILGYGRWFIKPSFDFHKNTPLDIYHQLTPARKELLGFKSAPPKDEFTRITRRSNEFDVPEDYTLPENQE